MFALKAGSFVSIHIMDLDGILPDGFQEGQKAFEPERRSAPVRVKI